MFDSAREFKRTSTVARMMTRTSTIAVTRMRGLAWLLWGGMGGGGGGHIRGGWGEGGGGGDTSTRDPLESR